MSGRFVACPKGFARFGSISMLGVDMKLARSEIERSRSAAPRRVASAAEMRISSLKVAVASWESMATAIATMRPATSDTVSSMSVKAAREAARERRGRARVDRGCGAAHWFAFALTAVTM